MKRKFLLLLPIIATGCQLNGGIKNSTTEEGPQVQAPAVSIEQPTSKRETVAQTSKEPQGLETFHPSVEEKSQAQANASNTAQADDLWLSIATDFNIKVPDNARVTAQRNWYIKHPHYMQRISQRADPFLYFIVEEIQDKNLPLELALLPIVESAFDPFAYSHGRASGLWQFIPGTAKRFGMPQNWWYDGRRDVTTSTKAALAYLSYLNRYFDGDWLHAIAAYNSGEGRVRRAIKKNQKAGKATDFWSLDLPKETKAYVPKLLALADMIKHQKKYGVTVPAITNTPRLVQVDAGSQIDLALAADMVGLSVDKLQKLNPGYNRWATPPEGPHTLLLPHQLETQFFEELAKLEPQQRLKWTRHKVVSGDTLGAIAQKYHSSSQVIRSINHLKGNLIRINQALLIPVASKELSHYSLSSEQRLAKTQSSSKGKHRIKHKVKRGDTLWDLANTYQVSHRQLAKWNGMAPKDTLRLNQNLVIWKNKTPTKVRSLAAPNINSSITRKITYKVRSGDSLSEIADKFNVKVADVLKWNDISRNKYLQLGQKIKLYVDVTKS